MNILHIAPEWKWSNIFILPIAKEQNKVGESVWVSTPNCPFLKTENKINFVRWNSKYKNPVLYFKSVINIFKNIKKNKIDTVYCHTSIDSFIYIFTLSFFSKINIIYVNHGVPYRGYKGFFYYILKFIEFVNVNCSKKTITITKSMSPFLNDVNLLNKEIQVMKPGTISGINFEYKSLHELLLEKSKINKKNKIRILYVGRIEKRKGIYDLIYAIENTKLDCELLVLGGTDENYKNDYNKEKIKFLGFKDDLSEFYLNSDILCVPSHHEGFGQVYLEAASYGVIPICSNIPGPTDFIKHNHNGFVVEPASCKSLIKIFDDIQEEKFNLSDVSKNAYLSSLKFESSNVLKHNMELF